MLFRIRSLRLAVLALCLCSATDFAYSQLIDRIDVERRGKEAEISIHLNATVQYLRHAPANTGKSLRIYARVPGGAADLLRLEFLRPPDNDMVSRFSVTYPEADDAFLIEFDQPTTYTVRPGADGRSIRIFVPLQPGAKDWLAQVTTSPQSPAAPGPVTAVTIPPSSPISGAQPAPPQPASPHGTTALTPPVPVPEVTVSPITQTAPPPTPVPAAPPVAAITAPLPPAPRSTSPTSPAPAPLPATTQVMPVLTPLTKEEIEIRALEWITAAQEAVAAQRGVVAAQRINQVLSLPMNTQTETAQALMGTAREFSGELSKARAEYELYLKLYPNGKHVDQVKEKLAALGQSPARASASLGLKPTSAEPATWTTFGSVSQYMYFGKSQIETITPPPPGQLLFNRDTLSLTDQHSLISNVDMQARRRDGTRDTRLVFRDSDNRNYLNSSRSYNRLNTAYAEQSDKQAGYLMRAGRQLGTGGGVMGRFDGLLAGYNLNPTWRVNAVAGSPVEFGSPFHRGMYGASLDYAPQLGKFGYSLYYNAQSLEGKSDRQAVGTEIRYFDPQFTLFGMIDYDINFNQLNIAMMQGNYRTDGGTSYFANIDIRKSPPLSLTTALPGQISLDPFQPTLDFRSLFFSSLNNLGLDDLRTQASILTADSEYYALGFTRPVTQQWQVGADYRLARISGIGASGILPEQPSSGSSHVISGQVLGNSLLMPNDSTVINTSFILAPHFTGQSYNLTYVLPYQKWRFDGLLRFYIQKDDQDQRQVRISPTFKVVYRWRNKVSLETEIGTEIFDETGPLRELHTRRYYIFTGYRWDLQ